MFLFLVCCILLVLLFVAWQTTAIVRNQGEIVEYLNVESKEIKAALKIPVQPLAYGWWDNGFPLNLSKEEERRVLENPTPHIGPDEYTTQSLIAEYKAILSAHERKQYLQRLRDAGAWMAPDFLDLIYADADEYLRSWAAGHLSLEVKDYSHWERPVEIRNYEPLLLPDSSPLVRAAYWSNPRCRRLPWSLISISERWKEHFHSLTQLERLGLMRNPELSMQYVVALLDTASGELQISQQEHIAVLTAAAQNPRLINGSRHTGRDFWQVEGDVNPPFEEYAQMWELALDRWIDKPPVPFVFIKYIQTTPKVKLTIYDRLLKNELSKDQKWLRLEVIRSCDPFVDKDVLKAAWDDPDEECRKIAEERVGSFTDYVGVKTKKAA
jgi:hypothetical protein